MGNPKAPPPLIAQVGELVKSGGHAIPVRESGLARYSTVLPLWRDLLVDGRHQIRQKRTEAAEVERQLRAKNLVRLLVDVDHGCW